MTRLFFSLALVLAAALPARAATDTLEPLKKEVADKVARLAVEDMHFRYKGRKLVVAPFRNDGDGFVAAAIKEHIQGSGWFDVVEPGMLREIWDKIAGNDKEAPITAEKAVELGKSLGAEAVMFGRVELFAVDEGRTACDVKLRIVNVADGDGLFIGRYRSDLEKSLLSIPHFRVWMYDTSAFVRILIWTVAMLILPFLTLLARETLSQAAPVVPIALMLGITFVDMMLALLLMGFAVASLMNWVFLVLALAASIFYNLTILAKVAELQLPGKA